MRIIESSLVVGKPHLIDQQRGNGIGIAEAAREGERGLRIRLRAGIFILRAGEFRLDFQGKELRSIGRNYIGGKRRKQVQTISEVVIGAVQLSIPACVKAAQENRRDQSGWIVQLRSLQERLHKLPDNGIVMHDIGDMGKAAERLPDTGAVAKRAGNLQAFLPRLFRTLVLSPRPQHTRQATQETRQVVALPAVATGLYAQAQQAYVLAGVVAA